MCKEQLRLGDFRSVSEEQYSDEIPVGYKKTEIGLIPKDWEITRLRDCLVRQPEYGINAPAVSYSETLPTYIRITDITDEGRFSSDNIASVAIDNYHKFLLTDGDIVFARTGASVGKYYRYRSSDGALVFAGFLIRVHPDKSKLLPQFLEAYLGTTAYHNWVRLVSTRSGQPGINGKEYSILPIPVPSIAEQAPIAEIVSDVDNLIESLDNLISKKQAIKEATMQQLLTGRTRLPGFKRKWNVETLGKFGSCLRGVSYDPTTDLFTNDMTNSVRLLRANNVQNGIVEKKELQFVNKNIVREDQFLRKNNILLCMANGSRDLVGKAGFFDTEDGYAYSFGAFMGCFRCESKEVNPRFVFYLLNTKIFRDYIRATLSGSSINNLKPIDIEGAEFSFPDHAEQNSIVLILFDIDSELQALKHRRDKIKQIKQGMMQQLLTGRIRLLDKEAV